MFSGKPGQPTLQISHQTVINEISGYSICTALVGNPAGSIRIYVKMQTANEFTIDEDFEITYENTIIQECNTKVQLKFRRSFTTNWNNTLVRCTVENDDTISASENMTSYTSNEEEIILIPGGFTF